KVNLSPPPHLHPHELTLQKPQAVKSRGVLLRDLVPSPREKQRLSSLGAPTGQAQLTRREEQKGKGEECSISP
ncbi:hypothetical protein ILYODFUR_025671, partial [Ilyodon furcidens]